MAQMGINENNEESYDLLLKKGQTEKWDDAMKRRIRRPGRSFIKFCLLFEVDVGGINFRIPLISIFEA